MPRIIGNPSAHRSRLQRARGSRALLGIVAGIAAPRSLSSGAATIRLSGGAGAGAAYGAGQSQGNTIIIGIPATGKHHKTIGHYRVGRINWVIG
jgi:hypothetical protein